MLFELLTQLLTLCKHKKAKNKHIAKRYFLAGIMYPFGLQKTISKEIHKVTTRGIPCLFVTKKLGV